MIFFFSGVYFILFIWKTVLRLRERDFLATGSTSNGCKVQGLARLKSGASSFIQASQVGGRVPNILPSSTSQGALAGNWIGLKQKELEPA